MHPALSATIGQMPAEEEIDELRLTLRVLRDENARLRASVRNQKGDNQCHLADPDNDPLPPWPEMQESCRRFHAQRTEKIGTVLIGSMTIAQLETALQAEKDAGALAKEALAAERELTAGLGTAAELVAGKAVRAESARCAAMVEKLSKASFFRPRQREMLVDLAALMRKGP
jgi:hypothetical protein